MFGILYFYIYYICLQQRGVADRSAELIEEIANINLLSSFVYCIFIYCTCSFHVCIFIFVFFPSTKGCRSEPALIEVIAIIILGQCSNSAAAQKNNWSHCHYHRLTFLQLFGTTQYKCKDKCKESFFVFF